MWERVYGEWKDRGVEFVGIGLLSSREKSKEFVDRHRLTFPNGFDANGRIAQAYGFRTQPYWAVIDREGRLLRSGFGPRNEEELTSTLRTVTR